MLRSLLGVFEQTIINSYSKQHSSGSTVVPRVALLAACKPHPCSLVCQLLFQPNCKPCPHPPHPPPCPHPHLSPCLCCLLQERPAPCLTQASAQHSTALIESASMQTPWLYTIIHPPPWNAAPLRCCWCGPRLPASRFRREGGAVTCTACQRVSWSGPAAVSLSLLLSCQPVGPPVS